MITRLQYALLNFVRRALWNYSKCAMVEKRLGSTALDEWTWLWYLWTTE